MQKKSIIFIFFIVTVFQTIFPQQVLGKSIKYVALGDSIAYGYGLENIKKECYSQIVKKELDIEEINYSNLAVSGITCKDYYNTIQSEMYNKKIKEADLITISVGSNEILKIAIEELEKVTKVDCEQEDYFEKVQRKINEESIGKRYEIVKELYNYFNSEECNNLIDNNIKVYEKYWNNTIKYISEINPNVTIVATEFYNPYFGIKIGNYDLGNFTDNPIKQMNEILWKYSENESKYKIAEVYEGFNSTEPRMTNVNINISVTKFKINMDPHPNKDGHILISEKIIEKIMKKDLNGEINIERTVLNQERSSAHNEDIKENKKRIPWYFILSLIIIMVAKKIIKSRHKH